MTLATGVASCAAFLISLATTFVVRRIALSKGIVDVPNQRSSHAAPTPRGGGVGIVLATLIVAAVLALLRMLSLPLVLALAGGGGAVAAIGFLDDWRPLPARLRLGVHFAATAWALWWLGDLPAAAQIGGGIMLIGVAGYAIAAVGLVWFLNLYNFMDGIDGIAATEAIFITWAGALITLLAGGPAEVPPVAFVIGAAAAGFLVWNWPPAKIFMGDVGSGYLGFVIGVLAFAAVRAHPEALFPWIILAGVFIVDATLTLLRRLLRGERVYEAHRSHAYQWLTRRWQGHKPVTLAVAAVNVFWLLPCACYAALNSQRGGWLALLALAPLVVVALIAGAGRKEV